MSFIGSSTVLLVYERIKSCIFEENMMYSIKNKCEEVAELEYEDGLRFYYFYTGGNKGGNDTIKVMLHYIWRQSCSKCNG